MNDIDAQVTLIADSVNRILWQVDSDPLSPSYGCAHLAYWRDKTSDVADTRRQEAMLALALLYSRDYPSSAWKGDERIKTAISAMLLFWCRNQYPDGSMDEWYKGERGFAAVAFSTHAVARTLLIMKGHLSDDIFSTAVIKLRIAAQWLSQRDDLLKTNHQAVCVAALAWAAEVTQKSSFRDDAYKKLRSILNVQTREGWFPELGCMDIGYTFLTVEFIAMALGLWNDWTCVEQLRRAFDFACEWVHPDLDIGSEYGICHNTYLSRTAVVLMSKFSCRAAYIYQKIEAATIGFKGYSATLADDLRLLRWSYQPLLAYEYRKKHPPPGPDIINNPLPLSAADASGFFYYAISGIGRFSCSRGTGIFAPACGGLTRFFNPVSGDNFSDYGYAIRLNSGNATNSIYNKNSAVQNKDKTFEASCPVYVVERVIPPFWARLLLRIFCMNALGSKVARKAIDIVRKKKGTAINQCGCGLKSDKYLGRFNRQIVLREDEVTVKDRLILNNPVKKEAVFFLESINGNWISCYPVVSRFPESPAYIRRMEIIKRYSNPDGSWSLKEATADFNPQYCKKQKYVRNNRYHQP